MKRCSEPYRAAEDNGRYGLWVSRGTALPAVFAKESRRKRSAPLSAGLYNAGNSLASQTNMKEGCYEQTVNGRPREVRQLSHM